MIFTLVLCMLLLSAFFSGVEIAYFSANRLKIELRNIQGEYSAKILSRFIHKPGAFITTLLIGNNLALVIYGIGFTWMLTPILTDQMGLNQQESPFLTIILQTFLSTLVILLFGEFIPKALFRRNPDQMMQWAAFPMLVFSWIFFPLAWLISNFSFSLLKVLFKIPSAPEKLVFGRTDLDFFMKETLSGEHSTNHESSPDIDTDAFNKALDFNKTRTRDLMVPRIDIEAVPLNISIADLQRKFVETGLSRLVVYADTLDQVKGTVHSIELFKRPTTVEEVIQPVLIVPETMPANLLLSEFTRHRKSIALVVDEFGGTAGLVTIEDLIEEILGDIEDEHDAPDEEVLLEKAESPDTWLFSARQPVDYLNEKYNLNLPEGDYTTLGGLVMYVAEAIPSTGDVVNFGKFIFTIVQGEHNRLETIRLSVKDFENTSE